jgi:hypothetical protein
MPKNGLCYRINYQIIRAAHADEMQKYDRKIDFPALKMLCVIVLAGTLSTNCRGTDQVPLP